MDVYDLFYFTMYANASETGRLFLAILPDSDRRAEIYRKAEIIKRAHAFRGQLTAPDRLHVTLFPLSGLPRPVVATACEAVADMKAGPFDVSFDSHHELSRPGRQPALCAHGGIGPSPLEIVQAIARHRDDA